MTTPTQAGVLAILDGCITPQNKLRMAIIRAYIEGHIRMDSMTVCWDESWQCRLGETVRKSGETDQLHGKIVGRWSLGSRKRPWI